MDGSREGARQLDDDDSSGSELDEPSPYDSDTEDVDLEEFVQSLAHELNEWRVYHMNDLDLQIIGNGFFGEIYKATERHSKDVVVMKTVKKITKMKLMCAEIRLMCRLKHPNILRFLGVCIHESKVNLITKYMDMGNLEQLVLNLSEPLPWSLRMKLAHDIAEGMAYLHGEGVIHRDLGSKNVLISNECGNYVAVVGDFGLAAKIPSRKKRLNVVGSPYWMAPEVIRHDQYNETVDIFSYGIILCEIIGRVQSSPDDIPRTNKYGLDVDKFREQVEGCPPEFLQLAVCCCQLEPESRPPFELTAKFLEYIMQLAIIDGSPTKLAPEKCNGNNARRSANIEDWLVDKKKILEPSLDEMVPPPCSEVCVCDAESRTVANGTHKKQARIEEEEEEVPSNDTPCKRRRSNKRNSLFAGIRYKYFRPTVVTEDLVKNTPSKLAGFFNRVLHVQKRPRSRKMRSKSTGSSEDDRPKLRSYRLFDENKERRTSEVVHREQHAVRVHFDELEECARKSADIEDTPCNNWVTSPAGGELKLPHKAAVATSDLSSLELTLDLPSRGSSSPNSCCSPAEQHQAATPSCISPDSCDPLDFSADNSGQVEKEEPLLMSWPQASLRVTNLSKSLEVNGFDELDAAAIPRCKSESNMTTKPLSMKFRSLSTCPQPKATKTRKYWSFLHLFRKQGKEKQKR